MTLKLAELIDLETQLLRDEQAFAEREGKALNERDRSIGQGIVAATGIEVADIPQRLASDVETRREICRAWLLRLPKDSRDALPGTRIENGYNLIGWILLALFALLGVGSAQAVLGDGDPPVNILNYVGVFFVAQMGLLLMVPVFLLFRKSIGKKDVLPWFQGAIARISRMHWVDKVIGKKGDGLPDTLSALKGRQTIYGGLQQWTLFVLLQRTATIFNLAALLTSFYVVTFYDLAFSWSTTLDVAAADLHNWLSWIAAPWSWLDYATPSETTVELSRWVPTEGGFLPVPEIYQDIDAVKLRRSWWPFLVAGLVTWGLLPRILAWGIGIWRVRRAHAAVSLDHMAFQHLFERLFPASASWSGPSPDSVRGTAPEAPAQPPRAQRPAPAGPCHVIAWGSLATRIGALQEHMAEQMSRSVDGAHAAGTADLQGDRRTLEALARSKASRIILALPEGHQPTKEVMRFLAELRNRMGSACELVVGLLAESDGRFSGVDSEELAPWRSQLLAQADPYLCVQALA